MTFIPQWQRFQYDDQGTNQCPYMPNTLEIFGVLSPNSVVSLATTFAVVSPIVVSHSSSINDEIFYFVVGSSPNSSNMSGVKIVAVRSNGARSGVIISTESLVWSYVLSTPDDTYNYYLAPSYPSYNTLVLSDDGETLYYSNGYKTILAINTATGSLKWRCSALSDRVYMTPYFANGCLHTISEVSGYDVYGQYHFLYITKLDTDGNIIEDKLLTSTSSRDNVSCYYSWSMVFNTSKTELYLSYYDQTSGKGTYFLTITGLDSITSYGVNSLLLTSDLFIAGGMAYVHQGVYDYVYMTSSSVANGGLWKITNSTSATLIHNGGVSIAPPCIHDLTNMGYSGISNVLYRSGSHLYSIRVSDNSVVWSTGILPSDATYRIAPIVCSDDQIYVYAGNTGGYNDVYVFGDNNYEGWLITSTMIGSSSRSISATPSMGNSSITPVVYVPIRSSSSQDYIYLLGSKTPTTTTTTSSTTSPTTTTTTSTGTGTTTTTTTGTTPTTTTTTTTPPPLGIVQTTQFEMVNNQFIPIQTSNASDDSTTQNLLLSQSLSFGTTAPNETSKIIIVALNVPYTQAITNIRIGLVSVGGIEFANNIFGITNSVELRDDIMPDSYFQGVNSTRSATSVYNINIPNKDSHTSQYVYLNVKLPQDQIIGEGIVKFKWYFDYS